MPIGAEMRTYKQWQGYPEFSWNVRINSSIINNPIRVGRSNCSFVVSITPFDKPLSGLLPE